MFCKTLGTMCPINLNVKKNRAYINVFTILITCKFLEPFRTLLQYGELE